MGSGVFRWSLYLILLKLMLHSVFVDLKTYFSASDDSRSNNFTESTARHEYRSEEHTVVTEDGYVLTMFRMPKGKNCHKTVRSPPVLLLHGLLVSSDGWIDSGPDAGLAYLIADECYDLWLPNVRGNHYSRRHLKLNPDEDPEYWNFTPHEIGVYDAPAIVDYILRNTGAKNLNYIGYSQGGAAFVIMCSERRSYCDKVRHAILLHPASRMNSTKSITFRFSTKLYNSLQTYVGSAYGQEVLPQGGSLQGFTAAMCQNEYLADTLCRSIMYLVDSSHPGALSVPTIQTLSRHFPAGTSAKVMSWYNQRVNNDRFERYDYGREENVKRYGQQEPPGYDIKAANVPVVIIHGKNDYLTSPEDVQWLASQLPSLLELYYVEDPLWNHLDVLYNRHLKYNIFPKIKEYLLKNSE